MKRLIAAGVLILIIMISCISGNIIIGNNCNYIIKLVEDCENSYNRDRSATIRLSGKLEKEWQSRETLLSAYSNHGYIEDVKASLAKLVPYAESDKEMLTRKATG